MIYALIGDIHSSVGDLTAVMLHINNEYPSAKIICTGDIFECKIGEKRAKKERYLHLEDVIDDPNFLQHINFPSVYGNQEERIISICLDNHPVVDYIKTLPRNISIEGAIVMHGHEWEWTDEPWNPILPITKQETIFFGHSHQSMLYINGERESFCMNERVHFTEMAHIGINVGSVIDNREWLLYDSVGQTIEFKKTAK